MTIHSKYQNIYNRKYKEMLYFYHFETSFPQALLQKQIQKLPKNKVRRFNNIKLTAISFFKSFFTLY